MTTSAASFARAKAIFLDALDRATTLRGAYLDEACGGDPGLRGEVESLLTAHAAAGSFLENGPLVVTGERESDAGREGQRIGPYQLVRVLGQGGMGTVYLANRADGAYTQEVALKLLKRGTDSDLVVRHFRAERQILARLDHPHIARLLDGGTSPDGLPYFVMEYVDGSPIDAWCDERGVGVAARLRLFTDACDAVHYAHQNLVVHRDIKPANIMITRGGVLKLLDFGIAKVLDDAADVTQSHLRLMTPRYASPEQVRGEPVTTATDVHALGVLLYELLAGASPWARVESREAMARAVCDEVPAPPSVSLTAAAPARRGLGKEQLRRQLAGDLDNVVAMAMRKEPARRYASADRLGGDVRRHLAGLPVAARRDTFGYRLGKFLTRNRWQVAAAGIVAAALVASVAVSLGEAAVARAQRGRAERRFRDVRALADTVLFELHDAIAELPGSTPARALLAQRALVYLDSLAAEASGDAELELELAAGYQKLGDVEGNPDNSNLGDTAAARAAYDKGLALTGDVLRVDAHNPAARRAQGQLLARDGDLSWMEGKQDDSLVRYRDALALLEPLLVEHPADADLRRDVARVDVDVGDAHVEKQDRAAALASYQRALDALMAAASADKKSRRMRSVTENKIGDVAANDKDWPTAMASYREALALREALLAEQPDSAGARRDLSTSLSKVGRALDETGDFAGALAVYDRALAMDRAHLLADPLDARAQRDVLVMDVKIGMAAKNLAGAQPPAGEARRAAMDRACASFRAALDGFRDLEAKGHTTPDDPATMADLVNLLAKCDAPASASLP